VALFDYFCTKCSKYFEVFFMPKEKPAYKQKCSKCGSLSRRIPGNGGYQMNSGPSSVRPKGAGAFRGKKK